MQLELTIDHKNVNPIRTFSKTQNKYLNFFRSSKSSLKNYRMPLKTRPNLLAM